MSEYTRNTLAMVIGFLCLIFAAMGGGLALGYYLHEDRPILMYGYGFYFVLGLLGAAYFFRRFFKQRKKEQSARHEGEERG